MTKSEAREEIRFATQNCEEIGLGDQPLDVASVNELEANARRLLAAIEAYRHSDQPS